jgi:hypothetical protein
MFFPHLKADLPLRLFRCGHQPVDRPENHLRLFILNVETPLQFSVEDPEFG